MTDSSWRTVDFQPAPPGWRVVFLRSGKSSDPVPLAGWLIQERYLHDEANKMIEETDGGPRHRRVIAGISGDGQRCCVEPVDTAPLVNGDPWLVLAPGEDKLSIEIEKIEVRNRAGA